MNKYKKIATAVVSLVLAGTMVGSMAACDGGNNPGSTGSKLSLSLDESGKLTYAEGTKVTLNIGYYSTSVPAYTSFQAGKDVSGKTYLIDGQAYTSGNLKPAWKEVATKLGLNIDDQFQNKSSDRQIEDPITNRVLNQYDIISGSLSAINQNSGNNNFVNLADYLEYMPNYSKFLSENAVTKYSLTGEATGKNAGSMYAAPYLDGNNDIENYVLIRKDWVKAILDDAGYYNDSSKFISFAQQAKNKTGSSTSINGAVPSIKSYMGKTAAEKYDIDVVKSDGETVEKITVDYGKALAAATNKDTPLGGAIYEAAGNKEYNETSGNIVDLQNFVIKETQGAVTGDKLAKIVREYILVTYVKGETPYYTTPSDVFNSVSAAWDVDLLAATLRAIVTAKPNADTITGVFNEIKGGDVYGIVARQDSTQRRVNLYSLAAQLYGVRGLESRLEYLYIDNAGDLKDARQDVESYELVSRLSDFSKEGILYTGNSGEDGQNSYYTTGTKAVLGAMAYDYVQTQTRYQMLNSTPRTYDFAPIVTPVSKWDVDGDGNHTDYMRFTESWRSVKNTGFCVPTSAVAGKPDKLSAVLTIIDYMFSEDGQMLLTYGTPSTTNSYVAGSGSNPGTSSDDGWWRGDKKSSLSLETVADLKVEAYGKVPAQYEVKPEYKKQVFVYEGEVYEGVLYGGRVVPEITDANRAFFEGKSITVTHKDGTSGTDTIAQASGNIVINQKGNYSDYARLIMGTTMPVGNKNQGFEYQCTAKCGKDGADIVDLAREAGVIKHVVNDPKEAESPWYFISPTVYPLTAGNRSTLTNTQQTTLSDQYFVSNTDAKLNIYIDIVFYGLGSESFLNSTTYICGKTELGTLKSSGEEYINFINGRLDNALTARVNIYRLAWNSLKTYYEISFS